MAAALDHLILLLPKDPTESTPSIPPSISEKFTLTPGGQHADGLTANTLILLADGCYIELICFIADDPSSIKQHWWGGRPHGWIDWSLTTPSIPAASNHVSIRGSLGDAVYAAPIAGGRKRPDGKEVKWEVTFPAGENGGQRIRGQLPFFCHDVTERTVRVPLGEKATRHPCGAVGVKQLTVVVGPERIEELARLYEGVLGVKGERKEDGITFRIGRVVEVQGLDEGPVVVLRQAVNDEERKSVEKSGYWFKEVGFARGSEETGAELGEEMTLGQP